MRQLLLEACVETVEAALVAEAGGARRIELCCGLDAGGVTPPADLIHACAARVGIPVFVLNRPRPGDFVFREAERELMRHQVEVARALGASRVLTSGGAPTALEGAEQIAALVRHAAGRIEVVAGGSVRDHNVREVAWRTGVEEVHSRTPANADGVRALLLQLTAEGEV